MNSFHWAIWFGPKTTAFLGHYFGTYCRVRCKITLDPLRSLGEHMLTTWSWASLSRRSNSAMPSSPHTDQNATIWNWFDYLTPQRRSTPDIWANYFDISWGTIGIETWNVFIWALPSTLPSNQSPVKHAYATYFLSMHKTEMETLDRGSFTPLCESHLECIIRKSMFWYEWYFCLVSTSLTSTSLIRRAVTYFNPRKSSVRKAVALSIPHKPQFVGPILIACLPVCPIPENPVIVKHKWTHCAGCVYMPIKYRLGHSGSRNYCSRDIWQHPLYNPVTG